MDDTSSLNAWTKPDVLRRWFAPKGWSLTICEVDLTVGGAWRFVVRRANGTEIRMRGVYREIVWPERFVHTQTFEMEDILYPTQKLRDGDIAPTEHGATESYAKLDEYFACTPTK